jgi:hypothetical protein
VIRRDGDYADDYRRGPLRDRPPVESEADNWHPGDALAAPDLPPYPADWTSEQRVGAYWAALRMRVTPTSTNSWRAILTQAQKQHQKHTEILETEGAQHD